MKNKKCYIHIGNFKTGSTTLQKLLFLNQNFLKKKNLGVIYERNFFKKTINNMQLFRYFNELDEKNITKYIKLNSSKHLIISSEYFSCISYDLNKIFFLKKIILKLGYEPIVIFLGRNYISFFNSLYREVLKQNKSLEYKDNIIEYLKKIKKYGYYFYNKNNRYYLSQNYYYKNNVIKKNWEKVFNKNFVYLEFNKKSKNKFIFDFIKILNLEKSNFEIPEVQNKTTIKFWHIKRILTKFFIYIYSYILIK